MYMIWSQGAKTCNHRYVALRLLVSVAVLCLFVSGTVAVCVCVYVACDSLPVSVLVGVLGSCGCPPPGWYKAPRQ